MLLAASSEEEQLQPAQHKQPGAQHHPDQREASGQQVACSLALPAVSVHARADVVRKYTLLILWWEMMGQIHVSLITWFLLHSLNTHYKSNLTCFTVR